MDPPSESKGDDGKKYAFTGTSTTQVFAGVLFDMDGTLIDSKDAIVKHWYRIGKELDIDPETILETSHGRRSIDTFAEIAPERANWDYVSRVEGLIPKEFGADAIEIPGARELLDSVEQTKARWAIVTSGTRALVQGWLNVMHLAQPKNLVVAEDVSQGKPDPECYLLGRQRIGMRNESRVLVVEDSPAGIRAGKAAGCEVLGLVTTYSLARIQEAAPDWIIKDLRSVKLLESGDDQSADMHIQISDSLVPL